MFASLVKVALPVKRQFYSVSRKKETKMFPVISSTKLGQFRWNLVDNFWINLLQKIFKHFAPHLNNVSTLPCETWNVHHAGAGAITALSETETPEFVPSQLWPPNSPDLDPVDYSVWGYCKRRCTKHASLIWMNWNSDWERRWIMSSLRQPFVSGVVDSCRLLNPVLYTSLAIFPTRCYQLDSNLVNLRATVEVG